MQRERLGEEIASARDDLAQTLTGLTSEQWTTPSLCDGWLVRDVVAHLVRLGDYLRAPHRYVARVIASGFRPNAYQVQDACRLGRRSAPDGLVQQLRASTYEQTWVWRHHPAPEMTLAELVIHRQDICRPLGITQDIPAARLRQVADLIVKPVPRPLRYPLGGWKLPTVRFEATDADWAWGSGPAVRAPLEAIVMTLAGRATGVPP